MFSIIKIKISRFTILCVIIFCIAINCNIKFLKANEPYITAQSAVLIEAKTGQIIYQKDAFKPMYPASTTKIMTAILGIEMGELNDIVKISQKAAQIGEASIYLEENQMVSLKDLIKGALIKSGNDAAYAIGEYVAGNEPIFVLLMNKKAAIMGAQDTNFQNTNGLPDKEHKSSAYDLALMGRYALQNHLFSEIVTLKEEIIKFNSGESRYLKNTNKLLWNYPYATGIKTGTTKAAGQCLVASAHKEGMGLIAVVLDSRDRYMDTIKLFEYGFNNWMLYTIQKKTLIATIDVLGGTTNTVNLIVPKEINLVIPRESTLKISKFIPDNLKAPINKGSQVGNIKIYVNEELAYKTHLIAQNAVEKANLIYYIKNWLKNN